MPRRASRYIRPFSESGTSLRLWLRWDGCNRYKIVLNHIFSVRRRQLRPTRRWRVQWSSSLASYLLRIFRVHVELALRGTGVDVMGLFQVVSRCSGRLHLRCQDACTKFPRIYQVVKWAWICIVCDFFRRWWRFYNPIQCFVCLLLHHYCAVRHLRQILLWV